MNYPIKYAIMPIAIENLTYNNSELENNIICYIVSKCYLISELTKYSENGKISKQYEIVFPYQKNNFNKYQRVIPTFNFIHGYCTNGNNVDLIFDSYEEAQTYAKNKNDKLCKKSYSYLSYSKDYLEKVKNNKDEFNEILKEYELLEKEILYHTQDMKIGNHSELTNVIMFKNNNAKILPANIYEILQLFDKNKIIIYSISQKQYNNLTKLIKDNNIKNSLLNSTQKLIFNQSESESKLITKIDTIIFYTTESIDDILNNYEKNSEIDLTDIKNHTLKKQIINF